MSVEESTDNLRCTCGHLRSEHCLDDCCFFVDDEDGLGAGACLQKCNCYLYAKQRKEEPK
jgi:hypothetical protein